MTTRVSVRTDDPRKPRENERSALHTLERRLDEGYARIEEAIARGEDVTAWESFWIDLLHQYEREFDALPEVAR